MLGETAHIGSDGHFVIIENDHHRFIADSHITQRLIYHTAGGCTVADQGDNIIVFLPQRSGPGHAQSNGHRAGCMACRKGIGITFRRLRKTSHSAELAKLLKIRLAAGQQLMDIRLMTHIKNQAVFMGIIYGLQGHGKLHNAQIGGQMATGFADTADQKFTDLGAKLLPLCRGQRSKIAMTMNGI